MSIGFRANIKTGEWKWIWQYEAKKLNENSPIWIYSGHESFLYPFKDKEEAIDFLRDKQIPSNKWLNEFVVERIKETETKQVRLCHK